MEKPSSRFLKKSGWAPPAQKLLLYWTREFEIPMVQSKKIFLLLFVHKKKCLAFRLSATRR
jgi:hypothetical protein